MPPLLLLLPARDGDGGPLRPGTVTAKDAAAANAFVVVLVGVARRRAARDPGRQGPTAAWRRRRQCRWR